MNTDLVLQLATTVAQLNGTTCWKVAAGGATGSRFNLDFGAKLEWSIVPDDPRLGKIVRGVHGEYGLQVGCAAWRLDNEEEPITAWTDLATPDGPMVMGLRHLVNCVVTRAEITKPGLDLLLEFDKKYTLRVFCDQFDETLRNYTVSFREKYVCIGSRSRIHVEVCDAE
jgi:hypothetical protein